MTKPQTTVAYDPNNPKHKQLKDAMKDICRQRNNSTLTIWVSISRALERSLSTEESHLSPKLTAGNILLQSYQRGLTALDQGETIDRPMVWLQLTSYQIVRELKRDR